MVSKQEYINAIQRNMVCDPDVIETEIPPLPTVNPIEDENRYKHEIDILLNLNKQLGFDTGMEALSELVGGGKVSTEISKQMGKISFRFSPRSHKGRIYEQSTKIDRVVTTYGGDPGAGWNNDNTFYKMIPSKGKLLQDMLVLELGLGWGERSERNVRGQFIFDSYSATQKPLFGDSFYSFHQRYLSDDDQKLVLPHPAKIDTTTAFAQTAQFFASGYRYLQLVYFTAK
jgi:hypothetical protein